MSDSANTKSLEELENDIFDIKIRLKRIEGFIRDMPTPEDYVPEENVSDEELVADAVEMLKNHEFASASLLQRTLEIGYARAAQLIDLLEEQGIVGEADGSKPRKVLLDETDDTDEKD